jgi:hypothetical protein
LLSMQPCSLRGRLFLSLSKLDCSMEAPYVTRSTNIHPPQLISSPQDRAGLGYTPLHYRFHGNRCVAGRDGLNVSHSLPCLYCISADKNRSTPVVGAQYRWTALYAPRKVMSPAFWSLLQGKVSD